MSRLRLAGERNKHMNYLIFIAAYGLTSYALWRIAWRLDAPRRWMAWVPFLREWLLVRIVGRSWKWFILVLVPIVNIYASWVIWGDAAKKLSRSVWLGRMMIVPGLNFVVLAVLAFGVRMEDVRGWGKTLLSGIKEQSRIVFRRQQ